MKRIKLINLEGVSKQEADKYYIRNAVRAVVFDDNNLVALLDVTKNNYYKLPGGVLNAVKRKKRRYGVSA